MKKKTINIMFWIAIFAVLIACLYIIMLLMAETSQCLQNAFTYGAREQVEGDVMCSCIAQEEGQFSRFSFNETSWWNEPAQNPVNFYG